MEAKIKNFTENDFVINTAELKENSKVVGHGIVIQINNDAESDITTVAFTEEQARKLLCSLFDMLMYVEDKNN